MPRCVHCGYEFAISEDFSCPACGNDWRGEQRADSSGGSSGDQPAHLALLDGSSPPPMREPKPRVISTAGPAMPVMKPQNDSVPNGWMARLEVARMAAADAASSESAPPALPRDHSRPPPLKRNVTPPPLRKPSNGHQTNTEKPAHLLVAQLEAEERRRRTEEQARLQELFEENPHDEIAKVDLELSAEMPKRRTIPNWVIAGLLVVLVAVGVGVVYSMAQKEPAPVAEIDPKLELERERRTKAMALLEKGHALALEGKSDKAIEAYQKALELEPTLASAVRGIAISYAAKKEDAKAVRQYKKYLKLAPDAKDADDVREIIQTYEKSRKKKRRK